MKVLTRYFTNKGCQPCLKVLQNTSGVYIHIHGWLKKRENGTDMHESKNWYGMWAMSSCVLPEWTRSKFKSSCSTVWPCCARFIVCLSCLDQIWNLTHYLPCYLKPKRQQQKMLQPYAQPWILCRGSSHILISSPTSVKHQELIHLFPVDHRQEVAWEIICLVSFLLAFTWPTSIL